MAFARYLPIALFAFAGTASAIEHAGSSPALHMELKDGSGAVVCFAYDTDPDTAPIADGCPEGTFTEQLFDEGWNQFSSESVIIGDDIPIVARVPQRVERTCVRDRVAFFDRFSGLEIADNLNPRCRVVCPSGVAIAGEGFATIPEAVGTDDAIRDLVSFTRGVGTDTIDIFIVSDIPLDVTQGGFTDSDGELETFAGLTYVMEVAAVCL